MSELVNKNEINETHANVKRSRSTFPLKQVILDTHRFGEYHPHLVIDGVTSDRLPWRSSHVARSYTLKAPLMQDIQMHKDYFMVPLRAILPLQADRIITNPTIGTDVPTDAYCNVENFNSKIDTVASVLLSSVTSELSEETPDFKDVLTNYFKYLVLLESIYSHGSLLASLGCDLCSCLVMESHRDSAAERSIDYAFDAICRDFWTAMGSNKYFSVLVDSVTYRVYADFSELPFGEYDVKCIYFREFLQRIRDTADWKISSLPTGFSTSWITSSNLYSHSFISNDVDIDLSRLWAYHLVCAEFYSNDKVDYVYSAELFREYVFSLLTDFVVGTLGDSYYQPTFTYNGLILPYDYLSSSCFNDLCILVRGSGFDISSYQYFLTLFGYHRSLRFKDYFTGARTRPLAVGDTNIPVVNNNVSVVDVSRNIQVQRFLNAVNATGRKFEEYLKGIFGVAPSPDHHNPIFLSHTSDSIFASEVENTAEAQQQQENSVTAVFRGNGSQFEFSVDVDEPCIIIGITSYDIERSYLNTIERSFFKKDRFDMFLPQMQFVGDQPIFRDELFAAAAHVNFGYTFRDMHFKQLFNRAIGGFASDSLPGYAFAYGKTNNASWDNISPDFIRSKNVELDEFYLSLTHYSLGTYFHFIVVTTNTCNASRPMAYNPQILG